MSTKNVTDLTANSELASAVGFRSLTVANRVAGQLRRSIWQRELAPGARLRQNDVARLFGVSSTPVREAFAQLQAQGLVRIEPRLGAIVFEASEAEMLESYEIRWPLEKLALQKAIPKLTEEHFVQADRMLKAMDEAATSADWLEANNTFHQAIYEASQMPRLCTMIADIRGNFAAYFYMFLSESDGPTEHAREEHRAILEACRARDQAAAEKELWHHFEATKAELLRVIRRESETASGM